MLSLAPNLKVKNVKETLNFYTEFLGFQILVSVPEYEKDKLDFGMIQKGGVLLMFQEKTNLEEEYPILKGNLENKGLTLFIKVEDVENLYNTIQSKVTIVKELHDTFYNTKEFAITDLNGFVLTFSQ